MDNDSIACISIENANNAKKLESYVKTRGAYGPPSFFSEPDGEQASCLLV